MKKLHRISYSLKIYYVFFRELILFFALGIREVWFHLY